MIRLRTGLRFDIQRSRSDGDMIERIKTGQADVIAALLPSAKRDNALNFTRPYLQNSYVLLTRKAHDSPTNLAQFKGKSLAIARGNPLVEYLRSEFPQIRLIETPDTFSAVEMLAEGQVGRRSEFTGDRQLLHHRRNCSKPICKSAPPSAPGRRRSPGNRARCQGTQRPSSTRHC